MGTPASSSDQSVTKLVEMGFDELDAVEAVKAVGTSCDEAIEYILKGHHRTGPVASTCSSCSIRHNKTLGKRAMPSSSGSMRQSTLLDHFKYMTWNKKREDKVRSDVLVSMSEELSRPSDELEKSSSPVVPESNSSPETSLGNGCLEGSNIESCWEKRVNSILRTQFGISSMKFFQKEALFTWQAHRDCLVLAATGSGKSLCFQIPALLTGKVVVVISPLISLMHDQCLKLSKHGVSACFLGSGQPDRRIEQKAMRGMYQIIYVCPETVIRLVQPLERLAETRGIALFAIDEAHCVSKWGHDFRPLYRKLSVLRENFSASNLAFLEFDVPIMALTATATVRVREDILESLHKSKETKVVLTSFFRPNLRFSVKHSRTTSTSSYAKDFQNLIDLYSRKRNSTRKNQAVISLESEKQTDSGGSSLCDTDHDDDEGDDEESNLTKKNGSRGNEMSIDYLEDERDNSQSFGDWDVACGEFCAISPPGNQDASFPFSAKQMPKEAGEKLSLRQKVLEGPTIIYVPTRKESVKIAMYLCGVGVKAAAYNASLPKSHLRQVHQEFHDNKLQVVVATIAFGMGIDKQNVRRIIHYGWPQSLEAYYQEAGRAGRDGKLADCILYADISRVPTLLPSRRSEEQTEQAYRMLSDCFRYGMNTSQCRAKKLVEYFGENFSSKKCNICDVCTDGPPELVNVGEEANLLIQVIASYHAHNTFEYASCEDYGLGDGKPKRLSEKPSLRFFISKVHEQSKTLMATDQLWWRGIARIMETKGFIKEVNDKARVQIKFPVPTEQGLKQLQSQYDQPLYVHPEADMLVSQKRRRMYSGFSEWGKGWADPEIRRQRLETIKRQRERRPRRDRSGKPPRKRFSKDV